MKIRLVFLLLLSISFFPLYGQTRSFDTIFPGYDVKLKEQALSLEGIVTFSGTSAAVPQLLSPILRNLEIEQAVIRQNPSFLVESLIVIPYGSHKADRLKIYNALGRVQDLKGRLYHSETRDADVPLFEEATRLSPGKLSPIPDPLPSQHLPETETINIRLKDINFGNTYYRSNVTATQYGITYALTNFKNFTIFFIPVIRENKFNAQFYIEPLDEGVLIYSIAGADVADIVAARIDMPSAIRKRIEVIIGWLIEGLRS